MNTNNGISAEVLKNESNELVNSVNILSEELPKSDITFLSQRLRISVKSLTEHLEMSFNSTTKMDKVRSWIRLSIALKECRDTLDLIEKLKYANTSDIKMKVENFNQMLIACQQSNSRTDIN